MMGGLGEGRPLAPACGVQLLPATTGDYVGYSSYRDRALVVVVVAVENHVHLVANKRRLKVFTYLLVAAMLRGAVDRPVEEHDLPGLTCSSQVALQPGFLLLRAVAAVLVVQLAIQCDEVNVAPVEGVVTPCVLRIVARQVKVLEICRIVAFLHVVVAQDREDRYF